MAKINEFDINNTYHKNDYCSYNGYLCICTADTTGPGEFQSSDWMSLGYILKDKGYVLSDEEELSYKDEEYLQTKGGTLSGNIKFNIPNETTAERQPFKFVTFEGEGAGNDIFMLKGGNDSLVLTSSNTIYNDKDKLKQKFNILPGNNEVDIVSRSTVKIFTGAETVENAQEAMNIDRNGDIHIKAKTDTVLGNNDTLIATEAQVYQIGEKRLEITKERIPDSPASNPLYVSKINGLTKYMKTYDEINALPDADKNSIVTKEYTDKKIELVKQSASESTDTKLESYLKLSGGTITGTLQIDNTSGSLIVPSKTSDPANTATAVATEAQLYKVNNTLDGKITTLDTTALHKAGSETVSGAKTFTNNPWISQTTPTMYLKNTDVEIGTAVSATKYSQICYRDKNGKELGYVRNAYYTSNNVNYSQMEIISNDPDPNHTDNRIHTALYLNTNGTNRSAQLNFSPGSTNATSNNQIATLGWVNNPSLSTNVVHRTSDETITGVKTFTGNMKQTKDSPVFTIKDTNTLADTSASSRTSAHNGALLQFLDKNDKASGYVYSQFATDGTVRNVFQVNKIVNSTEKNAAITINMNNDGTAWGACPTPPATNNVSNNYIATTGWVSDPTKSTNVVHRSGDETISGTKTYTSTIGFNYTAQYPNVILAKKTDLASNYSNPTVNTSIVGLGNIANDGTFMSYVSMAKTTAGVTSLGLNVRNRADASGSNRNSSLGIQIDANGSAKTWAPTPGVASNDTAIATTAYINTKFQTVSSLPSSPNADTYYFVTD